MEALNAEAAAATAKIEAQQQPGVSSAMMAERDDIMARAKQLLLQHDELTAEAKQLTIDSKAQLAQLKDLSNSLSDQRWALEVLGSDEVRRLANVVLGEILEAVDVLNKTGKSQEFDYDNWGRLNKAMREELQILD